MRMIHLFTDFGFEGPYVGEMKAVLAHEAENYKIVDLMHDVPRFNIVSGACLLSALSQRFTKQDACLAIVDPGVGSQHRRPILLVADGVTYCGPDNGLFAIIANKAERLECYEINWQPETLSASFHGRDLFAPSLVTFMEGKKEYFKKINKETLIGVNEKKEVDEIIYFDGFGNAITGRTSESIVSENHILINDVNLSFAETFSSVGKGQFFWYINSMGLVEAAINQGNIKQELNLYLGLPISVL